MHSVICRRTRKISVRLEQMPAASTLCRRLLLLFLIHSLAPLCYAASYAALPLLPCRPLPHTPSNSSATAILSAGVFVFGCTPSASPAKFYLTVAFRGTPVWTANSARPVSATASLSLASTGDVVLRDADRSVAWRANAPGVVAIALNDSGNLLFLNSFNSTVWESFDHPINILLPSQILRPGTVLRAGSSASLTRSSSNASFSAVMEPGGLALFVNLSGSPPLPYYVFGLNSSHSNLDDVLHVPCNNNRAIGTLTADAFKLVPQPPTITSPHCNVSQQSVGFGSTSAKVIVDYIRLESDGNVRGYKFENLTWNNVFGWFSNCSLPGACGPYGVCTSSVSEEQAKCSCPKSISTSNRSEEDIFRPISNSDLKQGCAPIRSLNCTHGEESQYFLELDGADYFANDFLPQNVFFRTKEECRKSCASNCSCAVAFYRTDLQACYLYDRVLSIMQSSRSSGVAFLKIQNISVNSEPAESPSSKLNGSAVTGISGGTSSRTVSIVAIVLGCTVALIFCLVVFGLCIRRKRKQIFGHLTIENHDFLGTPPERFTFRELQQATLEFNCKLGVGGFGSVYKGTLADGSSVAVKQLESARQGYKEFCAEVMALGNVNHQNLVRLRGFCAEGSHRLLVYDYMSNGSLDAWIFGRSKDKPPPFLDWNSRFQIALDVARGLAFLHEELRENIIHLNIKPQNILLDERFEAKVSDFGLSRLMDQDESRVITHMRGTPGYMAPEWLLHTSASEKSDVYSFGVVLLEILSGRKNVDLSNQRESWYLPALAARRYGEGREREVMDEKLDGKMDENQYGQARRMMQTAFWCIQEDPCCRPAMGKALLMLEGSKEVPEPPLAFFQSGGAISSHHQKPSRHTHGLSIGPSSPGYLNISSSCNRSSMTTSWLGGQRDDCSLLLSPRN